MSHHAWDNVRLKSTIITVQLRIVPYIHSESNTNEDLTRIKCEAWWLTYFHTTRHLHLWLASNEDMTHIPMSCDKLLSLPERGIVHGWVPWATKVSTSLTQRKRVLKSVMRQCVHVCHHYMNQDICHEKNSYSQKYCCSHAPVKINISFVKINIFAAKGIHSKFLGGNVWCGKMRTCNYLYKYPFSTVIHTNE